MVNYADGLQQELTGLFTYIKRVRQEVVAINTPADADHQFETMGDQLAAIVRSTEDATHRIMEILEQNYAIIEEVREHADDKAAPLLDRLDQSINEIYQACEFQDITGQRINKVTKSLSYVEQRVTAIVELWGEDEIDDVKVEGVEKTEDEKLLHGPQLDGEGLSQAEIDALFD